MSLEIATLSTEGVEHPIRHPLGPDGLAIVSSAYLAVRFGFHEESIYVEREVLKDDRNVEYTINQLSFLVIGQKTWSLEKGTYKVFGLSRMQMQASTQQLMPKNFTISTVHALVCTPTTSIGNIPPHSNNSRCTLQSSLATAMMTSPWRTSLLPLSPCFAPRRHLWSKSRG